MLEKQTSYVLLCHEDFRVLLLKITVFTEKYEEEILILTLDESEP
mgnify:CR=1 FL=1